MKLLINIWNLTAFALLTVATQGATNSTGVRFWRGTGTDPKYHAFVIPLDGQRGTAFADTGGVITNYFPQWEPVTWYFYNATNPSVRIPHDNPIAAFGSRLGGSPLYVGQKYRWGLYAGKNLGTGQYDWDVFIEVYSKTNLEYLDTIVFYVPNVNTEAAAWRTFATNGFRITETNFGIRFTLDLVTASAWGVTDPEGCYVLHAEPLTDTATNFLCRVLSFGRVQDYTTDPWLTVNGSGTEVGSDLFLMEFEARPPLLSKYIDQPHFDGIPLPPEYAGKSLEELASFTTMITNQIWLTNDSAYTTLDNSPELRRHPTLDQFVTDMRNDPLALTAYVLNEIELTDPLGYGKSGEVPTDSVNHGGIARNALGTFLERQGSPPEMCALLIYLLRQAGYPAGYVVATNNNLMLLDSRLSKLLRIQLRGSVDREGDLYTSNRLIAVNYPWVVANVNAKCVHIFPWLKDTEIKEGLDLWQLMPTSRNTAYKWVRDYVFGEPDLMNLGAGETDLPAVLFPRWIIQQLRLNHPGISIDDVGAKCFNRRKDYHSWDEMPKPNVLSNQNQIVVFENIKAITNAFPNRTLPFDSIQVEVLRGSTVILGTGTQRMSDIQNRKFLIYNTNSDTLLLWLEEFRPGLTGSPSNFTPSGITNRQVVTASLQAGDTTFTLRVILARQVWLTNQSTVTFMDASPKFIRTNTFTFGKNDLVAICLNYGRVTRRMLEPLAVALWTEESLKAADAQYVPPAKHAFEGTAVYLMGMSYLERLSRFDRVNQDLHKIRSLSPMDVGLAKFSEVQDGSAKKIQPGVDFLTLSGVYAANKSVRPDRHEDRWQAYENYFWMAAASGSAEEHAVINDAFGEKYAISTVKLLQLAQERSTPTNDGIVVLDVNNNVGRGNQSSTGYGTNLLKNYDPWIWGEVTKAFDENGGYARVFLTPASITNDSGKYKGMGALILTPRSYFSLISGNQHGGAGSYHGDPTPLPSRYTTPFTTRVTPSGIVTFVYHSPGAWFVFQDNSPTTVARFYTPDFNLLPSPGQVDRLNAVNESLNLGSGSHDQNTVITEDRGVVGTPEFRLNIGGLVEDPVNPVTGAFYVDAADLYLPGPMPLEMRRNYSSHDRGRNQLGHGWKLNYMPHLVPRTNAAGTILIDAAEPDGSVIAYRKTNSIWMPFPEDNPGLSTHTTRGIGSKANLFNARIERVVNSSATNFYLYAPDGSVREFKMGSFPITAGTSNGTSRLERMRPYLQSWHDHRGNSYKFIYEGDSNKVEYGQVRRVESSNGSFLGFRYDASARIVEAFTGDGRRVYYEYDQYGDLGRVTLPDGNEVQYGYPHYSFSWTNQSGQVKTDLDSTHLVAREFKPDGRILRNDYDDKRRVTNQLSTVGPDLNLVRNATFAYSNNFNLNKAHTNMVSGCTLITDINNNVTRYEYTNGLITKIIDPLNQTNVQEWYFTGNEEAGAYRRSLKSETDKRGLKTSYKYDATGNVTNVSVTGDLTGDGTLTQTATNTFAYNTNNLLTESVDPSGRKTEIRYHAQFPFFPEQVIASANGAIISTNFSEYYNVTNVVTNGTLKITNMAIGVLHRQIRAYGSSDPSTNEWERDGRGFVTRQIQYTGTSDPNITNSFFYNGRGELVEKQDVLGRKTRYDYDGMGRLKWTEILDETGQQLSGAYTYYNANGEPEWSDGPRYDPEDYVWNDYDGAGRQTTQIRWRSQAKADGSGVEAVPGYDQFATTYQEWDGFGNLIKITDPRGVVVTNTYDAIGRRKATKVIEPNGVVLKTEGFTYEPSGQVAFHTNAIGGVTEYRYTSTGKPRYQKSSDGSTNQWRYYLDGRTKREIQRNDSFWETTYDDTNRRVTRIFYSAFGAPLATNITEFDRRGNAIRTVDAAGFAVTNAYDGLDRVKWTAGPVIIPVRPPGAPEITSLPPAIQEAVTNYYDAAGAVVTNINALGHKTITWSDALGRVTRVEQSRNGVTERQAVTAYAANHHSVTITNGSGSSAVAATSFTDNSGASVLSVAYPASGVRHFSRSVYDSVGNPTFQTQASVTNGALVEWSSASTAHDGLNRPIWKSERDGAVTTFQYDPAGNLTNRVSPGGLSFRAQFNSKGQKTTDYIVGGALGSRTNYYLYMADGSLEYHMDGREVWCQYMYDDWLRPFYVVHSGALDEQNLLTYNEYDARGLLTMVDSQFVDPNTGPGGTVYRTYNSYGRLETESVVIGGSLLYGVTQLWDAAGRRDSVGYGAGQYGFNMSYNSSGLLRHVYVASGDTEYFYDDAGRLGARIVRAPSGQRVTLVGQRDGMGRPLSITNTLDGSVKLLESLTWTGDGLLATHTVSNALFLDQRGYSYANLSRRLTEERLNLDANRRWTNVFAFDSGQAAGPQVLTRAGQPEATGVAWSGGTDALLRTANETNSAIRRAAYGRVNGPATVAALLDGQPTAITQLGTQVLSWHATLELVPGPHQLEASAIHPSGQYTASTNHSFSVTNTAADRVQVVYDANGQVTQKIYISNGTTNRTQAFSWDAMGRLHKVVERDATQSGYDWTAVYDAFDRRLQTTTITVTNGASQSNQPTVIKQYYDPQYGSLEIGVSINGQTTWKVLGPSLDGVYGSLSGLGAFDATVAGPDLFCTIISDARGNILGVYDPGHNAFMWNTNRPTGYGAVPGHRPPPLGHGAALAEASAWHGRWADIHGSIQLAHRPYDPVAGRFLSFDPLGLGPSDNPYGFPADPINYDDPLGLFAVQALQYDNPQSPNPITQFNDYLVRSRELTHEMAQTLGAGLAYQHYSLLNAINGSEAAINSEFYQTMPALNHAADLYWNSVFQDGMRDARTTWENQHLKAMANPIPGLSYFQQWKYNPTLTFENHLFAALELSTMLVPMGGVARGAALAARADAAFGEAAYFGVRGELLAAKNAVPTIGGRAPINSRYAGQTHPSGIQFTDRGFPNFGPVAKAEVQLEGLTGNYAKDAAMANQAVGLTKTPSGYVWHHVEDGVMMQLVPQKIHNVTRHTGGAAVIRNGGFDP